MKKSMGLNLLKKSLTSHQQYKVKLVFRLESTSSKSSLDTTTYLTFIPSQPVIITTTTFQSKLNVNCVQQTSSLSLFNKQTHAPPVLIYTVLETLILTEMPYMTSNVIGIHHPFRTMELTIITHFQQTTIIIL